MADMWATLRSITSAALMADFAAEHGVSTARIIRGTGIRAAQLIDPTAEITAGQELALMRNLVTTLGDAPGLGLAVGARHHASGHGVWGFAVLTSPTVGSALEVGVGFGELSASFARITLDRSASDPTIVYDDTAIPPEVRRFHAERDLQATFTVQQDLIPRRLPIRRVEFPFRAEPAYRVFFDYAPDAEIVFGAPLLTIVVDPAALDQPLPQANPHVAAMYERQCAELVQRRRERLGVSGRVREALVHRGGMCGQPDIAADLNLSVRTLRRRLADEGTTFRELSEETFGLIAGELLRAGLTVEQTAARLGYSSASAFTHAFKSWRGEPPGSYSRTLRQVSHRPM
ncbi:AraC family transcriptional regulator [Nocardia jejuensis]|uniref:AraC family transcriptional regulator n=1 Tax=Nocardia jejuensis TaxID=328049 RepID=UPI0009FCCA96|nr:AraC family transcriptional regulator [Nocardia jejuensis]